MPRLYYVRTEDGHDGPLYATKREAQAEFQSWIDDGCEPDGVRSVEYQPTRHGIAALVNALLAERASGEVGRG